MTSYAVSSVTAVPGAAAPGLPAAVARPLFFDVPVDLLDLPETLAYLDALIQFADEPSVHLGLNAHTVVLARRDDELRAALRAASMCSLDGMACVWTARLLGLPVPERVTGIDIMTELLPHAQTRGWSVYFLGGTTHVSDRLVAIARERWPQLVIAGAHHGYFDPAAEGALVAEVAASRPTIVFLGLPSPQKELFAIRHRHELGAALVIGVGGSFDVLSGHRRRAPRWMQRTGLEWGYRLLQEPRRMAGRYLVGNPAYVALSAKEWWVRGIIG